ncbi:MAG: hypothetical protein LBN97_03420 [Oscillospiraceae bacterium]|jgi:diacylglycerol kinase family enzyme|nr:hypothetical protein [Oscillospiraceae bacterium]
MKHFFVIDPETFASKADFDAVCAGIRGIFGSPGRESAPAPLGKVKPEGRRESDMYRIFITRRRRDPIVTIYTYLRANSPEPVRVYAIGDDGTQSDCLNGVANFKGAELAAIPVGTYIGLNRMGALDAVEYIKSYVSAPTMSVDILNCGNVNALNYCAVGLQTEMIVNEYKANLRRITPNGRRFEWLLPRLIRKSYYRVLRIMSLLREEYLGASYYITIDGEEISEAFSSIFIWNAHLYPGHFCPPPEPDYQDGQMNITLLRSSGLFETLHSLKLYDSGKAGEYPYNEYCFRSVSAKTLEIHSNQPLSVNIDGEKFVAAELKIMVEHGALNYVKPQKSPLRKEPRFKRI